MKCWSALICHVRRKALALTVDEDQLSSVWPSARLRKTGLRRYEEVVRNRLSVYREQTAPGDRLLRVPRFAGVKVDGIGSIEDINQRLVRRSEVPGVSRPGSNNLDPGTPSTRPIGHCRHRASRCPVVIAPSRAQIQFSASGSV